MKKANPPLYLGNAAWASSVMLSKGVHINLSSEVEVLQAKLAKFCL